MGRKFWAKFGFLAIMSIPAVSQAGWPAWNEFWDRFHLDTARNACWPEPFRTQDREALRTPFAIMKDNGWRFEHTLPDALFNSETQELNRAGEIKVRRILTYAPSHRRSLFVQRASNDHITSLRIEAVQGYVSRLGLRGAMPEVIPTDVDPTNSSGEYFDQIDRKSRDSVGDPRLPASAAPGSGGM